MSGRLAFLDGGMYRPENVAKFVYVDFGTSAKASFLFSFRRRAPAPQAAMPWDERARNARRPVARDRHFTGATLNEFAHVLRKAGAIKVDGWMAARKLPR